MEIGALRASCPDSKASGWVAHHLSHWLLYDCRNHFFLLQHSVVPSYIWDDYNGSKFSISHHMPEPTVQNNHAGENNICEATHNCESSPSSKDKVGNSHLSSPLCRGRIRI